MELREATDEEITAELERRKQERRNKVIPVTQSSIDWDPVIKIAEQYRDLVAGDRYYKDNDFKSGIYVLAMTAVFGEKFWDWYHIRINGWDK